MRVKRYCELSQKMDEMVYNGMNDLNPIIRSIGRKLERIYREANAEEKRMIDAFNNIPFR